LCIRGAIDYMERNLLTVEGPEEVAEHVYLSPMYLQKGFQILTGYSISEYIRKRRLYHAALELVKTDGKVIDIALKYGYDTPESFTKAFTRFHGASPSEVRKDMKLVKAFHPLKISLVIQGGENMNYTVKEQEGFHVIGFCREFTNEEVYREIPKFWNEIFVKYAAGITAGKKPESSTEWAMVNNRIGEYGICIDDVKKDGKFRYMVAGRYMGGEVPEGMELYELPACTWARFACEGPMPEAMQTTNTKIWKEWLPGNTEYELSGQYNVEWYSSEGNNKDADYKSEIWIPVKRK